MWFFIQNPALGKKLLAIDSGCAFFEPKNILTLIEAQPSKGLGASCRYILAISRSHRLDVVV